MKSMYCSNLLLIKSGEDCVFLGGPRDIVQGGGRELRAIPRKRVVGRVDGIGPGFYSIEREIKVE